MTEWASRFPAPGSAVVVGATGGIGAALVGRIAGAGLEVRAFARRPGLAEGRVVTGTIDVTDEASIARACDELGTAPPVRLVIVASGLLHDQAQQPEKSLRALDPVALARAFAVNAIGPALVAKHMIPLMPREGKAVFAVISARVGSIADNRLGGWYGYRASKAALNQLVRTTAIEVARTRPETIVVALHPGTVATTLSAPFRGGVTADKLFTPDVAAGHLLGVIGRLAPADSGGFFAWDGQPIRF